jgi:hypothetical protein
MELERSLELLMNSLLNLEGRIASLEKAVAEKQEPLSEDWATARLDEMAWRISKLENRSFTEIIK